MSDAAPKGVTAVLVDETGHAIATASDFATNGYGGFTLKEAQTMRVKERVARVMVEAYASDRLSRLIDGYASREMMANLTVKHGYRLHLVYAGYAEDES